jgi:hypothetical protein
MTNKEKVIANIHTIQDQLATFETAEFSANWVIGLLSQIATDVAKINEQPDNTKEPHENNS